MLYMFLCFIAVPMNAMLTAVKTALRQFSRKSVAHLQNDEWRCRADLRKQITLPFSQQTKCTRYLNISGLGPSQSALFADHFAAI